jgi:hypothetical protein
MSSAFAAHPTFAPIIEPFEPTSVLTFNLLATVFDDRGLCDEYDVEPAELALIQAKAFPQQPLCPVPAYGATNLPAHRESEAAVREPVLHGDHQEQIAVQTHATPKSPSKIRFLPEPCTGAQVRTSQRHPVVRRCYAASRFRPFCRRRFRTSWPPRVRIRTKKPCVRLRFLLLGW